MSDGFQLYSQVRRTASHHGGTVATKAAAFKENYTTCVSGSGRRFRRCLYAQRDQSQVPLRLQYLSGIWDGLETVQAQLEDIVDTPEGQAEHAAVRADFESRLFTIKASLTSAANPNPPPSHSSSALSGIKLPTISLPEFDGDYRQWLAFHDTFLALIHSNTDVPDIQKFHYLRAAVKGKAAKLIESIGISSENYALAWQTLEGRYSNDYLLKKRHLQALFDIPCMKKESAAALHGLVDEFERYIKILHQLGEPTGSWSTILEHLLCTRLHDNTLREWENYASTAENPDYTCLIDFLQRRTRVLESISVNHHHDSNPTPKTSASVPKRQFQSQFRLSSCASTAASFDSKSVDNCAVCSQPHMVIRCPKFNQFTSKERQPIVIVQASMFLKTGHMVRYCSSNFSCRKCNRRHHTLLYSGQSEGSQRTKENVASSSVSTVTKNSQLVIDAYGQAHLAPALLDSASQPNLITERMAQILRLRRERVNVIMQGAGKLSKPVWESVFTEIHSRRDDFSCGVNFLVMDKVTANLPPRDVPTTGWKVLKGLFLADPSFNVSQPIDMVLGARHFYSFFPSTARIQLNENLPLLVDSVFGWIIVGSVSSADSQPGPSSTVCSIVSVSATTLEDSIERFWRTEELTTKKNYSAAHVRFPKKPDFGVMLGESKSGALRRFELLERRLERNLQLKDDYHQFMREYLSLGHMKLVQADDDRDSRTYYSPHHSIIKEAQTVENHLPAHRA
ncbi:uncharacterized protein LOC129728838 [Wyeomyia smithii]|uniref:uncharacterized protein LOC129728838 n=1 Tax=Wyeomyia smithii TaxID=174621 RepID=UPI002467E254|nr:uncharacterized protein LOC129728838 [Wyeomyia smithii]